MRTLGDSAARHDPGGGGAAVTPTVLVALVQGGSDVRLAAPAIRSVAASGARVVVLSGRADADAARMIPDVDEVHVLDTPWIDGHASPLTYDSAIAAVAALAEVRCDEAIVLTSPHQSPLPLALLLRMADVSRISAICDEIPGSLLDLRHHVDRGLDDRGRALSLVAACGYRVAGDEGALACSRTNTAGSPDAVMSGTVILRPAAPAWSRAD